MSSPLERRLRDELAGRPAPGEAAAGERSGRVVAAALGGRPAVPRRRRPALAPALAALVAALVLAATLTPAGAAVGDWIGDRIGLGPNETQPTLAGFPRGGRLLAVSEAGAWVVNPGGAPLRRLGGYSEVAWSPRGLFVLGTAANRVTAMEPDGEPRWSIVRRGPVSHPAWSPGDGFRVAYLEQSGAALSARVADGSGRLDHRLRAGVAAVTPAWRPGRGYRLTLAGAGGRILTLDADSGRTLWSAPGAGRPRALAWTRDGRRLAVLLPGALDVYARDGRLLARRGLPGGAGALALALHPGGRRATVAVAGDGVSRVLSVSLPPDAAAPRELFSGPGRFRDLEWDPDGRRLLVSWPEAGQWLLLGGRRPRAFAGVARQLDPGGSGAGFPRLSGWCCSRGVR